MGLLYIYKASVFITRHCCRKITRETSPSKNEDPFARGRNCYNTPKYNDIVIKENAACGLLQ